MHSTLNDLSILELFYINLAYNCWHLMHLFPAAAARLRRRVRPVRVDRLRRRLQAVQGVVRRRRHPQLACSVTQRLRRPITAAASQPASAVGRCRRLFDLTRRAGFMVPASRQSMQRCVDGAVVACANSGLLGRMPASSWWRRWLWSCGGSPAVQQHHGGGAGSAGRLFTPR